MAYGSEVEKLERRWMENPMGVSFAPLAEAYRRAGDQPRALEVLAIGLANHPAYVPALIVQARCHLDVQSDGAAEESFLAVLATDGHNLIALKGLADICERSDRPEQASKHLDRLLEADPTHDEGRVQMDRLTAVLLERERLRGSGAGTPTAPASAMSETEVAPVEPMGFEPTDAGSQDDPSALEDETHSMVSLVDSGEEPAAEYSDAGDSEERSEPELIESVGWDAVEGEPVTGAEPTELDFEVEKEIDPFEAEEADAPSTSPSVGSAEPAVPFEEELPAPWLDESPDEPIGDASQDAMAVELPPEADPPPVEAELESESPVTEPEAPPALTDSIWAPMGSAKASEGAVEPPSEPIPEVDEARAEEAPWAETMAAEPPSEPEQGPESQEAAPPPPETLEPLAEASDAREYPTDWRAAAPPAEATEEVVAAAGDDAGAETGTPADNADGPGAGSDTLPSWEASTEIQEDLPAPEPSPPAEDAEPVAPTSWQDPALEEAPAAVDAGDEVTLVDGAESELPADPEPEIEPALIMTETMARLFERQGHRTMALAIYAQLAEQAPGNPDLAAAVERLTGELSRGSGSPGTPGRGAADAAAVDAIVGRGPAIPADRENPEHSDSPESGLRLDAPATRASEDLFSLSAVFGPARPGPAAQSAAFASGPETTDREPSFDEFFGSEVSAASDAGQTGRAGEEDLEQFTAWLRGLKR